MNDDTGITSIVSQLHQRLDEARGSARNKLTPVEELVGWEQGDEESGAASASKVESEQETDVGDHRTLVTPPPKEESGDGEETSESATETDSGSRQCSECGRRYHADVPDEEHPDLCEECIVSRTKEPAPTMAWREESLGRLDEAILDVLHEAYPQELSASEIADRLPNRNIQPADANRSAVNSELYGDLRDWLSKKGRRPPVWSLETADKATEDSSDREADNKPSRSDDGDGRSFKASTTSSTDRDSGTREPGAPERKQSTLAHGSMQEADAPGKCPICSEPMVESHEWRNERMCTDCYEALKDI